MLDRQPTSTRYAFVFLCLIALFGALVIAPVSPRVGAQSVGKVTRSLSPPSDWLGQEKSFATPIGQSAQSQKGFSDSQLPATGRELYDAACASGHFVYFRQYRCC
jgi:hypothetical protein